MRFNDAVIGILAIIVGIVIIFHVQSYPPQPGGRPGPALFPMVLSGLLIIAGSVLVVSGRRQGGPLYQVLPDITLAGVINIMLTLSAVIFYVLVARTLGFLLTSFIIMVGLMLVLKARLIMSVLVAIGTTLCIYLIFNKFLMVPLPRGILSF